MVNLEKIAGEVIARIQDLLGILRRGDPAAVKQIIGQVVRRIDIDKDNLQALLYLHDLPALALADSIGRKCASVYMPEVERKPN